MDVIDVPFCDVCRQSVYSQIFKKHAYTKKHQAAATRLLQSAVDRFERQCDTLTNSPFKYSCPFCQMSLHDPETFLTHFQCERHQTRMRVFCVRNRCDPHRTYRQKLTLSAPRARHLRIALDTAPSEQQSEPKQSAAPQSSTLPSQNEAKASRKNSSTLILQRPEGIHRVTEYAEGIGLVKIPRLAWNANVGNVYTSVLPPWMEAEQTQVSTDSAKTRQNRKAAQLWSRSEKNDIFAQLAEEKYTPDWLPNFGAVWQSGPRSKTKRDFMQKIKAESMQMDKRVPHAIKPPCVSSQQQATERIPAEQILDHERQRLLLQKEKLRAKLAKTRR